jgi:glycosyltransferase involved in cell wall biosynthesis
MTTLPWGRRQDNESLFNKIGGRVQDIARIRRTLASSRFSTVVVKTAHDWATLSRDIPLLVAVRHLCPKITLQLHGSSSNWLVSPGRILFKYATRLLLGLSDAALILSSEEQRQWQKFHPTGNFFVVSNPFVPATVLSPEASPSTLNVPECRPTLLFVGRLVEAKGVLDLLNALPRILKQVACHLIIIGEGPMSQQLQATAKRRGLMEHVTFAGYLRREQIATAYRTANIFVFPSFWNEGFPTVLAEAMNAGLPIVTTHIRGAADHLQEGINALFVPPRDEVSLTTAVCRLLTDPDLCMQMRQANREKVKDFAPDKVGRQYLDVLEQIIGEPK